MGVQEVIESIEEELRSELNPQRLAPYGAGSQGYKALSDYLSGKKELNRSVEKQLHEYRVFLAVLDVWVGADRIDSDDIIFFSPSTGTGIQFETAPSLFVEPVLPIYPENDIWREHKSDYYYLQEPESDGPKHHTKPDMLLTRDGIDKLPWTAQVTAPPKNESTLMSWCAQGEFDRVKKELGLSEEITNAGDCYSVVQRTDKKKDSCQLYKKWHEFESDARYIIESKHQSLDKKDFSQILWYGLAYKTNIVLISNHQISNRKFKQDLKNLPVKVEVVEGFDTTISREEAENKLSSLQN